MNTIEVMYEMLMATLFIKAFMGFESTGSCLLIGQSYFIIGMKLSHTVSPYFLN